MPVPENPIQISPQHAPDLTRKFSRALTPKVIDYLRGHQLSKGGGGGIEYWTGPMVSPTGNPEAYQEGVAALKMNFTPVNMLLEVCERRAETVVADEPAWMFTPRRDIPEEQGPTQEEQALMGEADAAVTAWYDRQGVPSKLLDLTTVLVAHGRAPIRFFVDPRKLVRNEQGAALPQAKTLEDALKILRIQFPSVTDEDALDITSTGVFTHPTTLQEVGVWWYEAAENGELKPELELSWLDDQDRTVLRRMRDEASQVSETADPLDLWGYLWIHELKLDRGLVSDDLLRNQDALNVANTMLPRNTHFAGFLERYGIGIQPPGNWVPDEDNPGELKFVPAKPSFGPGSVNFWQAAAYEETTVTPGGDKTTSERPVSSPQYGRFEPSKPDAITAAIQQAESNIYSIARQRFVLMSDNATASGRSREVATGDHLTKGNAVARAVEHGLRGILEFALAFAAALTDQSERFKALRASVQTRVKAFTPTPEERQENRADVAAGLMSAETATSRLSSDPDAERQKIQAELNTTTRLPVELLKQGAPLSVVLQGLLNAGVEGISAEDVRAQQEIERATLGASEGDGLPDPDPNEQE